MPRFGPTNRRQFVTGLRQLGFDGPYAGTRHQIMVRGEVRIRIPNPHQGDIDVDLLVRILRQAGVSREEWESV